MGERLRVGAWSRGKSWGCWKAGGHSRHGAQAACPPPPQTTTPPPQRLACQMGLVATEEAAAASPATGSKILDRLKSETLTAQCRSTCEGGHGWVGGWVDRLDTVWCPEHTGAGTGAGTAQEQAQARAPAHSETSGSGRGAQGEGQGQHTRRCTPAGWASPAGWGSSRLGG